MTKSWSILVGFTHVKEKKTDSSLRGSTPKDHVKKIDKGACVPTSTEVDENQDTTDQESLEKDLREGDENQPKLRHSSWKNPMIEDEIKEQELLSHSTYYDVMYSYD